MDSKANSPPTPPLPITKKDIVKHGQQRPPQPPQHRRESPTRRPQLHKAKSWSPNMHREEAWQKRKEIHLKRNHSSNKSLTDSDLDELKACFELGFSFDSSSSKLYPKLTQTFPALEFYCNVLNNKLPKNIPRSTSLPTFTSNDLSPISSPKSIIQPGDDPEMVKMRLRHWAQVVACSLHLPYPK